MEAVSIGQTILTNSQLKITEKKLSHAMATNAMTIAIGKF